MVIAGCIGVGKPNTGCGGIACVTLPRLAAGGPGLGTAGVLGVVTSNHSHRWLQRFSGSNKSIIREFLLILIQAPQPSLFQGQRCVMLVVAIMENLTYCRADRQVVPQHEWMESKFLYNIAM